jgi:hypothetical protein
VTQQVWDCAETRIDAHLTTCRDCRDELAGLASLPALLARVSPEELDRIAEGEASSDEHAPPELAGTVLDLTAAHRRRSRWRWYGAAAAAVVAIVVGMIGGMAAAAGRGTTFAYPPGSGKWQNVQASSPVTGATAMVSYAKEHWGTALAAEVDGIPRDTTCQMYVVYADGSRAYAMAWTTADDEGTVYYSGSVPADKESIAGFQITAGGKTLVSVPT